MRRYLTPPDTVLREATKVRRKTGKKRLTSISHVRRSDGTDCD